MLGCNRAQCMDREARSASRHVNCMGDLSLAVLTIVEGLDPLDGEDRYIVTKRMFGLEIKDSLNIRPN